MKRILFFPLAIFLLCALPAFAQGGGEPREPLARGFKPNRVFDFNGVDSVNLYNGNLTLSIPIGQEYPVGGNVSYRFRLVHNLRVWEIVQTPREQEEGDSGPGPQKPEYDTHPEPSPISNAGLGWTLTFGMLFEPGTMPADYPTFSGWTYVDPSGARYVFEPHFRGLSDGNSE